MSNPAHHWLAEIDTTELNGTAFKVLFFLCDHHNAGREPWSATFPTQKRLMERAGCSNGGLNKALDELENAGLIRRRRATEPGSAVRRTYFLLGLDFEDAQSPQNGDSPNSDQVEAAAELSPLSPQPDSTFRPTCLHSGGDKPVIEPEKEPVCAAGAAHMIDLEDFLGRFLKAYPRLGDLEATEAELREAIEAGADPDQILAGARAYAAEQKGNERRFIKLSENWLREKRWEQFARPGNTSATDPAQTAKVEEGYLHAIRTGNEAVGKYTPPEMVRKFLDKGLVTDRACRRVGVQV